MLPARNIILISSILALFRIGCLVTAIPTDQPHRNSTDQPYGNSDDQPYGNSDDQPYGNTTDVVKERSPFNKRYLKRGDDIRDAGGEKGRQGDTVLASSEKSLTGVLQDQSGRALPLEEQFNSSSSHEKSLKEVSEDVFMHASSLEGTNNPSASTKETITRRPTDISNSTESLTTTISSAFSDLFLSSVSGTTPSPSTPSYSSFGKIDQNDETTESLDHTKGIWTSSGQRTTIPMFQLLASTTEGIATTGVSIQNNPEIPTVAPASTESDILSPSHGLMDPYSHTENFPPMNSLTVATKSTAVTGIPNTGKRDITDSKSVQEITTPPVKWNNPRVSTPSLSADSLPSSGIDATKSPQTQARGSIFHYVNNSKSFFDEDMVEISTNRVTESLSDKENMNIANMTVDHKKRSVNDIDSINIFPISEDDGLMEGTILRTDNIKARYRHSETQFHYTGETSEGSNIQAVQKIRNLDTPDPLLYTSLKSKTEDVHAISLVEDTFGIVSAPNNSELEEDRPNYENFSPSELTLNEQTTQQISNAEHARPAMILKRNSPKIGNDASSFPPNDPRFASPDHHVEDKSKATDMNPLPTRVIPLVRPTSPLPSVVDQLDIGNSKEITDFAPVGWQAGHEYITEDPIPKPLPTRVIPLVRPTSPRPDIQNPSHRQNSSEDVLFNPNLRDSDPVLENRTQKTQRIPTLVAPTRASEGGRHRPMGSGGPSGSSWDSLSTMVRTPVGEMNSRNAGLMLLMLMVVSSVLVIGLLTLAAYWIKAKMEVRRLDREMRTACIQGLDHGFVDQGL